MPRTGARVGKQRFALILVLAHLGQQHPERVVGTDGVTPTHIPEELPVSFERLGVIMFTEQEITPGGGDGRMDLGG